MLDDPRTWSVGSRAIDGGTSAAQGTMFTTGHGECQLRSMKGPVATITVEQAMGGAAGAEGVTSDFRRVFRIDLDTSKASDVQSDGCTTMPSIVGYARFDQDASQWAPTTFSAGCE